MQNSNAFIDSAKVMAKGQVTIPADVRKALGVSEGDRVSFVVDGNNVRIVNAALFAMQMLQAELKGEAERLNLNSEEDVNKLIKEIRNGEDSDEDID
jgi:AbrB family looped-hinge helix DNA binding protein